MLVDRYDPEDVFARVPEVAAQTALHHRLVGRSHSRGGGELCRGSHAGATALSRLVCLAGEGAL